MAPKSLPLLVSIPPTSIRSALSPEEWEACLDAWIALSDVYLRSDPKKDLSETKDPGSTLEPFLTSFYCERRSASVGDRTLTGSKVHKLQSNALKLTLRLAASLPSPPSFLTSWDYLADFAYVHLKSKALSKVFDSIWQTDRAGIETTMAKRKKHLVTLLETNADSRQTRLDLEGLALLLQAFSQVGPFFFTGSDLPDALFSSYDGSRDDNHRKLLVAITYLGLTSLLRPESSSLSLLSDHLYQLKASADRAPSSPSLLADIVTNTPLMDRLQRETAHKPHERLQKLLKSLVTYRLQSLERSRPRAKKYMRTKGKSRSTNDEFHIHQMSLVTQVQDLFPDLGSGFILKLLDEYDDDVERATASLLEDALPAHLANLDRTEDAPIPTTSSQSNIDHLAPRSTPPPTTPALSRGYVAERRNVFDGDELDRMQHDISRLHIGKKDTSSETVPSNKAAILSALAAFDSDDDERDDTYDVDDVGGTIDTAHPDGEPPSLALPSTGSSPHANETDRILFPLYKSTPELFGRTFDVRRSQARATLKSETRMTDEAIEGWAIMLQRDPKRLRRLEVQVQTQAFDGRQTALASTAYRGSETEDSDGVGNAAHGTDRVRGGGFRGRAGRGVGRGGGRGGAGGDGGGRGAGGNVAGSSQDPSTAAAQKRKEAHKGSRANHNRRDQRAKKMARGGFAT